MKTLSGSEIVDKISRMRINSIPESWYRTIRKGTQPDSLAILVLWDLIYWYKWTEVRDEHTGNVIEYRKKFKADLLQRSYQAIADRYGITKSLAVTVIKNLEALGVLKRIFRKVRVGDVTCSNVLFIELVPERIAEVSDEYNMFEEYKYDVPSEKSGPVISENRDLSPSEIETYTITSQTNSQSLSKEYAAEVPAAPAQKNETQKDMIPFSDIQAIEKIYFENWEKLYHQGVVKTESPVIDYKKCRTLLRNNLKKFGAEVVAEAMRKSIDEDYIVERGYGLNMILSSSQMNTLINSNNARSRKKSDNPIRDMDNDPTLVTPQLRDVTELLNEMD